MAMMPVEGDLPLLAEAGYTPALKLDSDIVRAMSRFEKGKTIPWKMVKRELKLI
jgi:hypothetical protein